MKKSILVLALTILGNTSFSQTNLWNKTNHIAKQQVGYVIPTTEDQLFVFDIASFKSMIKIDENNLIISLPISNDEITDFKLTINTTMSKELMIKYPEIRAWDGIALDGSGKIAKVDVGPDYFRAMILQPGEETMFIDPAVFTNSLQSYYKLYKRSQLIGEKYFSCETESDKATDLTFASNEKQVQTCELRTYRVAIAATGEYTAFHGGTVAQALAAQVTTMNRVNGIYQRDLAITMTIIPNNDLLIYTNSSTDPYTNGNPGTMIGQNQTNITNVIGSANYDIGHVFGTNSGGLAQLDAVCKPAVKARGVTGSGAPTGDAFDIDYVAHEMGHQFGANHTFNNSCSGNRNNPTAMEPGSGSTILAYAGICPPNVQNNSNDYFHAISLHEIGTAISKSSHACPVKTPLSNVAPVVASTSGNMTVPSGTPFMLKANATDANGNNLTYCWEQMDNEISTQAPVATSTSGPNFRSYTPSTSPIRYFPSIANQTLANYTWERLATVGRTYKFRVTVRNNTPGGGCTEYKDVTVTTDPNSGPFTVLYPNLSTVVWQGLSQQTVTWDVANTTAAPIYCANVKILLSIDAGETFTVLKASTPNDGEEVINVPDVQSNLAVIMVSSLDDKFFDVSDRKFKIIKGYLGVEELEDVSVQIFPNPANDFITVNTDASLTMKGYKIYAASGQLVAESNAELMNQQNIDISALTTGVYFFETTIKGQKKTLKLIKE